jgi:glycosyltransferase involved in cell wall biosynthesis
MLRRSIQCFLNQTYPNRELVVVYQSDDDKTRQFLAKLRASSIHPIEVPAVPRLTLGCLRNIARQEGNGTYIAQWDDDDWHSPTRLAEQMRAIREAGKQVCLLSRLTLYDCLAKRGYVSGTRPWEGSLVAERAIVPPFPNVAKGEDTPVVNALVRHCEHVLLDRPELYIYIYHGRNTWDRDCWDRNVRRSQLLDDRRSGLISKLLDINTRAALQFQ